MTNSTFSLSAIKTFRGTEGNGFNAKLHRDGKHIADLLDSADGGPMRIEWLDYRAPRVEGCFYNSFKNATESRSMTPNEAALEAWFLAQPREVYFMSGDQPHYKDSEAFLNGLVDDAETMKRVEATLKRDFKKAVVYIKDGAVYTSKPKDVRAIPSWIEQCTAKGYTVLNTMEFRAAVAAAAPLMIA